MSNIERILNPALHPQGEAGPTPPPPPPGKPADQPRVPNPRPNDAPVPPGGFKVSPAGLRAAAGAQDAILNDLRTALIAPLAPTRAAGAGLGPWKIAEELNTLATSWEQSETDLRMEMARLAGVLSESAEQYDHTEGAVRASFEGGR